MKLLSSAQIYSCSNFSKESFRYKKCQSIKSLEAIDYGVVTDEDLGDVSRLPLPYEKIPLITPSHDVVPGTAKEVRLLDVGGGVTVAAVSPVVVVAGQGGDRRRRRFTRLHCTKLRVTRV